MKTQTLLEKAKGFPRAKQTINYNNELLQLSTAWLKEEISLSQFNKAMGKKNNNNSIVLIGYSFREMYRKGLITIKEIP